MMNRTISQSRERIRSAFLRLRADRRRCPLPMDEYAAELDALSVPRCALRHQRRLAR